MRDWKAETNYVKKDRTQVALWNDDNQNWDIYEKSGQTILNLFDESKNSNQQQQVSTIRTSESD